MLVVETIAKIRQAYFVQGKAPDATSRELKISRKVVRKVIRSGATAFAYERTVQPQPKLGPWREVLEQRLATNAARSSRERLTLPWIFAELRGLGYAGGYDAVRRHTAPSIGRLGAARAQLSDRCGFRAAEFRPSCRWNWARRTSPTGATRSSSSTVRPRS